jgi:acyl-CoA thioesterase I
MGFGMEGPQIGRRTIRTAAWLTLPLVVGLCSAVLAQTEPVPGAPAPPAVGKECGEVADAGNAPLPNSAAAIQARRQLKILAIGSSSVSVIGNARDGNPPLLEQILEHTVKGVDVEIINRGFSGELAAATGARLKIEVALNHPDVVLWQVGTNDAFAQVPPEEFEGSVKDSVRWLKEHNIDVILVGLHYMKHLATDPSYQAIRASLRRVATSENVLRIGRYEAMEVLARTMREPGRPEATSFGLNQTGYNCMAQHVAHAIAVGLFAKPTAKQVAPSHAPMPR